MSNLVFSSEVLINPYDYSSVSVASGISHISFTRV